jgi:hypothetical protein
MIKAMALFNRMISTKIGSFTIKDFARTGPRPIVGCALEYLVILDERGRYRAQQVSYLKAAQVFEHKPKPSDEVC